MTVVVSSTISGELDVSLTGVVCVLLTMASLAMLLTSGWLEGLELGDSFTATVFRSIFMVGSVGPLVCSDVG